MRVVVDTNIWIAGLLLPKSMAGEVIAAGQQNKFSLIVSQPILDKLKKVLAYLKIQKRLHWNEDKIDQYLSLLGFFAEFVELKKSNIKAKVAWDANDAPILHTLIASKADYLVIGDNDLLCLKQDYPIITLAEFHKLIQY